MRIKLNVLEEENIELQSQLSVARSQLEINRKFAEIYTELKTKENHDPTQV